MRWGSVLTHSSSQFMLHGKPIQLIAGSMSYYRMVPEVWEDRLRKLSELGANAVEIYVPWNYHEQYQGEYDFSGSRDVASFVRLAAKQGLMVILRPGPYICAEWSQGGLPFWLLTQSPRPRLRTSDAAFLAPTTSWFTRLFKELRPLMASR